ncbi:hypothetical protein [Streptomyces sp. NPDC060194]|uniref:hypothetical protein n=1 Tax=Streptomyces sp. NPDC060194 TaxID=3347069 RepID=UPI00365470B2
MDIDQSSAPPTLFTAQVLLDGPDAFTGGGRDFLIGSVLVPGDVRLLHGSAAEPNEPFTAEVALDEPAPDVERGLPFVVFHEDRQVGSGVVNEVIG